MDDFDYSVQISDLDWDSFFQACEECNLLPPGLAGLDDSGMSDMDDIVNQRTRTAKQTTSYDPELQTNAPPDCEASPMELYLSKYGLSSPDQVLSGSEEDFHLEAVNVFFERLKSVSVSEDKTTVRSKMAHHSEGSDVKEDTKEKAVSGEISQSQRNKTAQRIECRTNLYTESTDDDLDQERRKYTSDTELFIREEDWSLDVLKEGQKWEAKMRTQPDTKIRTQPDIEKSLCNVLGNGKEPRVPTQAKETNSQLATGKNSDLIAVQGQVFNVTPRRRRRKKKRVSAELVEMDPGNEAQLIRKVSDSDEDTYARRGEMDHQNHMDDCWCSGTVFEACCAPQDLLVHTKEYGISENFSVFPQSIPVKGDIRRSTLVSPNLQKELSKSAVRVAQGKKEIDMSDSNLSGKPAEAGQLAMRADLKSPELGVSVTGTPQSNDRLSAQINGDNAGNHLQLNNQLPSEILASVASSDVSQLEATPVSVENPVNFSASHDTDDVKSKTHSAALQLAPLIPHNAVYAKTPKSKSEDKMTLSDLQIDVSSAVGQRKTSISCVTFPELTDKTLFSASYENTEVKENASSVSHNEPSHEHKQDDFTLPETFPFKLLTQTEHVHLDQISHQNGNITQMIATQIPKADEIKDVLSVDSKSEIANQKLSEKTGISNASVNSQSEYWVEEKSLSLRLKNVPGSQKGVNMKNIEGRSPGIKGDRNEELPLKGQTREYHSLIHTTELGSQLSNYSKSEPILYNIHNSGEEQKGPFLYVETPPCFSSKDHDLSPTIAVQHSPSPLPESTGGAKGLECVCQPTPPKNAISSFWNEMEKLTINDILHLRLVGQAKHPSVLLQPEDTADVTDAADSGYFTHSDESKTDHSGENMLFISDFDGELTQFLSSDATKPVEGTKESLNPTGIIWESDPNPSVTATGLEDLLKTDEAQTSPIFRNNSTHCFRRMYKNISVQNLQALEGQNLGKILRTASLHSTSSVYSTHCEDEDDYVDPFDRVKTSSPVYLSDEEDMDSTGITFSEILEYLFGTDEPKQSAYKSDTVDASYPSGNETSVPEMYDHFFSEFEPESFFYPLPDSSSNNNDELVPIFSSSRSATKNVQFPEVYDYFFPDDSPVHSDEDEEAEHTAIRVVTRYDHMPSNNHDSVSVSDPNNHILSEKDNSWNLWTNPFSFRRVRRTGFIAPPEESSSQALTPVKNTTRSFQRGIQPIHVLGAGESLFPDPLILSLENRIFRLLADQQKICSEMQTAIADPRLDAPLLPIKQTDMCLVCIAFASWVLKSVNPQGADTWKAVLLANISALSAIRYLRRFTRDEEAKISPLSQIKPA